MTGIYLCVVCKTWTAIAKGAREQCGRCGFALPMEARRHA